MDEDVGVVVPAYRPDVDTLRTYLAALHETVAPARLLVELDAPDPGVADAVRGAVPGLEVAVSPRRRGKGAAVTHGFERLDTPVLAFADADGSTPAGAVADVVAGLERAPVAVGSRRHPDAVVESHQSRLRRRFGDVFAAVARAALGVDLHDFQCGAKAMTAAAWRRIREHVYESGFAWDVEVIAVARALDLAVCEVPVTWRDDPDSTVDPLWTSLDMLRALVVVRHRAKALRGSRLHRLARRDRREPLVASHVERD